MERAFLLIIVLMIAILFQYPCFSQGYGEVVVKEIYKNEGKSPCDKGFLDENKCFTCHRTGDMKIIEFPPYHGFDFPINLTFTSNDTALFRVQGDINSTFLGQLEKAITYLSWHKDIKTLEIEILSGGGSLFLGWQAIGLLETIMDKYRIKTIVHAFAGSAAFLIWMGGEERLCFEHATLMHHELWTFEMFSLEDVSDKEESARVMRFMQDNVHDYLAKKCNLTKEELDKKVRGVLSYWMTGKEALRVGFATGLIK